MNVTITIPRFVTLTSSDHLIAEDGGLELTQGIGSLFIRGDLWTAAEFAERLEHR